MPKVALRLAGRPGEEKYTSNRQSLEGLATRPRQWTLHSAVAAGGAGGTRGVARVLTKRRRPARMAGSSGRPPVLGRLSRTHLHPCARARGRYNEPRGAACLLQTFPVGRRAAGGGWLAPFPPGAACLNRPRRPPPCCRPGPWSLRPWRAARFCLALLSADTSIRFQPAVYAVAVDRVLMGSIYCKNRELPDPGPPPSQPQASLFRLFEAENGGRLGDWECQWKRSHNRTGARRRRERAYRLTPLLS